MSVYLFHDKYRVYISFHGKNNSCCTRQVCFYVYFYAFLLFMDQYLVYLFDSKNVPLCNSIWRYLMFLHVSFFMSVYFFSRIGILSALFLRPGYFVLLHHKPKIDVPMSAFTPVFCFTSTLFYFFHSKMFCSVTAYAGI